MNRPPIIRAFLGDDEIIVDLFAGGGGASTGIHRATGRSPDIAINHSPEAIALHAANHPTTRHYIESVYKVDPRRASGGRPVALLWLSPDCTHHSKAKGGKPRDQKLRGLAWSAIPWAQHCRPRVIVLENVEEWIDWGPVDRATGQPIKARRGQTFRAWRRKLESYGYIVEHRMLRACDFGAPTTRRRLFLIARCDGNPIAWPAPTHGPVNTGRPHRHRSAAEIIDWSIPCPSIFDRDRPLADKTMARIARGTRKFALEAARPFVIAVNHGGVGRIDHRVHDLDAPMPTITGGQRGGHALVTPFVVPATHGDRAGVPDQRTHGIGEPIRTITTLGAQYHIAVPYLVHRSNGERVGQAPRIYDVERPLGTIVAQGQKHAVCAAFLAKHYSDRPTGGWGGGAPLDAPAGATTRDHHAIVVAHLTKMYGTSTGADPREPAPTITGQGQHIGAVAAFLSRYNGQSVGQHPSSPIGTIDTHDRYGAVEVAIAVEWSPEVERKAHLVYDFMVKHGHQGSWLDHANRLVTLTIDGFRFVVFDLGMRMLSARELFRATGFHDDYVIDPIGPNGKPLTKTAQIRACGNAVPPDFVDAIVGATFRRAA